MVSVRVNVSKKSEPLIKLIDLIKRNRQAFLCLALIKLPYQLLEKIGIAIVEKEI